MTCPTRKRILVLRAPEASGRHVRAVVRWARALVPAAVLIVTPLDDSSTGARTDSIVIDAEEVASGPLALADAIARAAAAPFDPAASAEAPRPPLR